MISKNENGFCLFTNSDYLNTPVMGERVDGGQAEMLSSIDYQPLLMLNLCYVISVLIRPLAYLKDGTDGLDKLISQSVNCKIANWLAIVNYLLA